MSGLKCFVCCVLGLVGPYGLLKGQEKPLLLQPSAPYSWWQSGAVVVFKPVEDTVSGGLKSLEGRVHDVTGKLLETVSVGGEDLKLTGWVWKPQSNGFYEIEFSWVDESGKRTDVVESYWRQAPNKKRAGFERKKFTVVVADTFDPGSGPVGQFGFTCESPKHIPLAGLVGFDLTRMTIGWGAVYANLNEGVESVKGERNWERYDQIIDLLAGNDMVIMGQINYTPLWASPHPEKTKVSVCVVDGTTYAPVNMGDFSTFVEAAVARYKDKIGIWEIWNEPAMPGGSIFWQDTPENYVRLLKAGYEAVKRVDPAAEVWNGGMGMRIAYYAFYDEILKLGAGPYFDKLSLHGKFADLESYRETEKKYKVPPKPAVMTEWHAILSGQGTAADMDTEPALALRMIRELFSQIKQGITKTMLFEMANQMETEAIPFALANQWITHSAGLFRREPRVEPRFAAAVMANFLTLAGKKAAFDKEVMVGKDGFGIVLDTNKGKLLAAWSLGAPLTISDLKAFAGSRSLLRDWEGKDIPLDGTGNLEPKKVYYLSEPDVAALAKAGSVDRLLPPQREERASQTAPEAVFLKEALPDETDSPDAPWITEDWKYVDRMKQIGRSEGFSARALTGVSKKGLDILVKVRDAKHVQNQKDHWWEGDSLQFGIDCEGKGMPGGNVEYVAALKPDEVVFWKMAGVNTGADLPAEVSPANGPVGRGVCTVTREGETTIYRIQLPWGELYPMVYDPNRKLKISLLVNNNDGQGRAGYLEWGGGIGDEKNPSQYGTLKPQPIK